MKSARHRILLSAAAIVVATGSAPSAAQQLSTGVAAIVNDYVIAEYDLNQRVVLSANLQMMIGMAPQTRADVLTALEDEVLILQEAARLKISVARDEVETEMQNFADGNRLPIRQIFDTINRAGVTTETFRQQIAVRLVWDKVVRSRFGADTVIDGAALTAAKETYLQDLRRDAVVERRTEPPAPPR